MNIEAVKTRIKLHEGFRLEPYTDTEGFLTGGFGHKILDGETLPTTKEGWEELFDKDFDRAYEGAMEIFEGKVDNIYTQGLDQNTIDVVKGVLVEMVYQLGKYGVLKFKNFLKALDEGDLSRASEEMLDSLWARQTPNRAKDLSLYNFGAKVSGLLDVYADPKTVMKLLKPRHFEYDLWLK